jgi:hypothetical protein
VQGDLLTAAEHRPLGARREVVFTGDEIDESEATVESWNRSIAAWASEHPDDAASSPSTST